MVKKTIEGLDHDDAEEAADLVARALKSAGMSKAGLLAALEAGFGLALWGREPSAWPSGTQAERDAAVAGRLILKLGRVLGLPLESLSGPSAKSIARELLSA